MKKFITVLLATVVAITLAGCSAEKADKEKETNSTVESGSESTSAEDMEDADESTTPESSEQDESTTESSEQETTTGSVTETTTTKTTEKTTQKSTEATTKKPTETETTKTTETEAPIVKKVGTVDDATYNKAVKAFTDIVKQLRADGIVKKTDVCVTVEGKNIKADINFSDSDTDLVLEYDATNKAYQLTIDYDFSWLKELYDDAAGKKRAPYNEQLFKALLSMVTDEVELIFDRIDADCYSAFGLYVDKWTEIGDCALMAGETQINKYITYYITKR